MQGSKAWVLVTLCCGLFAAVIVGLWSREVTQLRHFPEQLARAADVERSLANDPSATAARVRVPTGLFLLSFDFVKANEANLTGYVWQRHLLSQLGGDDDASAPGKARPGVVFPERVGSATSKLEEIYRVDQLDAQGRPERVVGWYFDVTLRQHFDYSRYPLDRHDVWLRLWPRDFDQDVVLVPDLGSYDKTGLEDRFGFDRDIVPGSWRIEDTFFSYSRKCYDTRFGIRNYVGQNRFPELHFNLMLSRRFENAFVVALVPLLSVLVLLFSVLVMSTADPDRASTLGFNASGALGAASALLFVVMLAHVSLRKELNTVSLVYLEYFYLVSYFAVLAVSINIYLFCTGHRGPALDWLHRHDNRLPKLAFWPLVLLLLAAVTVKVFAGAGVVSFGAAPVSCQAGAAATE